MNLLGESRRLDELSSQACEAILIAIAVCVDELNKCRNGGDWKGKSEFGSASHLFCEFRGFCNALKSIGNEDLISFKESRLHTMLQRERIMVKGPGGRSQDVISQLAWLAADFMGKEFRDQLIREFFPECVDLTPKPLTDEERELAVAQFRLRMKRESNRAKIRCLVQRVIKTAVWVHGLSQAGLAMF